MDPNANLRDQLKLAHDVMQWVRRGEPLTNEEADAVLLAELVLALDDWIRRGGFLPVPWIHPKPSTRKAP